MNEFKAKIADDIGPHTIMRISELLTPFECEQFYIRITGPDKGYHKLLRDLELDNEPKERKRRDIVTTKDCTKTLKNWVETQGDTVYWDRVSSALYRIGRLDIAKSVDELNKISQKLKSSLIIYEDENYGENTRQVRDLNSIRDEDWDLIVERQQLPPYNRHLNEWCWSMVYGVILGFFAAPLFAGLIFLVIFGMSLFESTDYKMHIKIEKF
ncbi:transmembrane and death domain protein 1 [Bufo gargarizans]|uniref:transmembrane and death domain protein 1 n=1 Tax=Bufo gargarizans TaxID=30331 RepID=UPI001CF3F810|nr:transmembrane and death domain protein 1 [Bufo gargarizans]